MRIKGYAVHDGVSISVTTSAGQKTGLLANRTYSVTNTGTEIAYINTNNETATVNSLPVLIGEKVSGIRCPFGTLNHIGAGSTTLVVNQIVNLGV